jgi:predicted kinase
VRVLQVLHKVAVQVFQRHQLAVWPARNAQIATPEERKTTNRDGKNGQTRRTADGDT